MKAPFRLGILSALLASIGPLYAQHDQNIANADGATVRADINNALAALFTLSSGASAPSTTIAYMLWADTTNALLKQRNAANTGWIVRGTLAEAFVTARASNTILAAADFGKTFKCTSSFTQTLTAAATLGDGWFVYIRNDGTGLITIDPNGAETIDGATTLVLGIGDGCYIICDGSNFKTVGLGRMALLSSQDASSSSSLDFANLSGFSSYRFVLSDIVSATDNVNLWLRISQDNGGTFKSAAAVYHYAGTQTPDSGATGGVQSGGAAQIVIASAIGNGAGSSYAGEVRLNDPASSSVYKSINYFGGNWYQTGGQLNLFPGNGAYLADTNAINAIRFLMSSGNIASGNIKCYGIRG